MFAPGWEAVRANSRPILIIQSLALLLLVAYYASPALQVIGADLGRRKEAWGLAFPMATAAFAGFVLPAIAKRVAGLRVAEGPGDAVFQVLFFGTVGCIVDVWYRVQTHWFGPGTDPLTVATKVLVDQFGFSVLISIPLTTTLFGWREAGFSVARARSIFADGGWLKRYGPTLASCWGYWLPILSIVYALPGPLQFWMFLCAQAAWSILIVAMGARSREASAQ